MNLFKKIREDIIDAIASMASAGDIPTDLDTGRVAVEPPREVAHGDIATNAAMVLGKAAGMAPRAFAEKLAEHLRGLPYVANVTIAGPGFINLHLTDMFWRERLKDILQAGTRYGDSTMGQGICVNVEYVSANPTGPMHVGHGRGAVVGDVLALLLAKAGYTVCKEYYINDAGAQIDVLARSVFLRYREALGETVGEIPEGLYPGDYLVPVGQMLVEVHGNSLRDMAEEAWLPIIRPLAIAAMMELIKSDLAALGIHHDVFFSERSLVETGGVDSVLSTLTEKGLIYEGILEPPKGKLPDDWEARPQTLFRATAFGDDVDRPLKKSDGSWTYFASDIAYHLDKFQRGSTVMIDIWGADHGGYVKRMQSAVKAITAGKGTLDVKLCQMVNLLKNGEPFKMSKRAGTFITLREVVDEVGKDVVRFIMLTRKNDAQLDFDLARVVEQSRDNPVFYVQYAHARISSVLRHAAEMLSKERVSPEALKDVSLEKLTHPAEMGLIKLAAGWPRLVESAAEAHEPHRIAFYLQELAGAFHGFWNMGKEDPTLKFLIDGDAEVSLARLAMITAVAHVIASGLETLGVKPVEEMR